MIRTVLLGAIGLVLAVALGLCVHLLTRDTVAQPVVRLDDVPALAPPATTATTTATVTTATTETETEAETEDGSGRGRNRGRGGGGGDD